MATPMLIQPIADARVSHEVAAQGSDEKLQIRQRVWGIDARTDSSVSFEEFRYWAKIEREEEIEAERRYRELQGPWSFKKMIKSRFSAVGHEERKKLEAQAIAQSRHVTLPLPGDSSDEKRAVVDPNAGYDSPVAEEEWKTAARAMRTATWGSIFFLITTDILGWSGCPFVFASVGYGPGVAIYLIYGLAALASGFMLWSCFIRLDSTRFPIVSYGDLFLRTFGPKTRHFINVTQSLQQFLSVALIIVTNGQIISQLAGPNLCYIVCLIISMVIGMVCGVMRSLQHVSWICNLSVWLNIISFIIVMVASARNGPDYTVLFGSTILPKEVLPIKTFVGLVPNEYQQQATGFAGVFNGVDSMVYAYSGALLFVAFMAEMRHPMDFWKGMICAQAFICLVYIIFGAYVYSNFGQYSYSTIYQAIEPVALQTVSNVFALLTGLFACILYFNIGLKTVYVEVCQDLLHMPPIASPKGRWIWYMLGPVYWILAFLIGAAVPNISGIVNFVGGLFSVNFTYSLPGIVFLGVRIHDGAILPGEGFDPVTGETTYHDSGVKRWIRGFMNGWWLNLLILAFTCGALASSGMGTWAAVIGLVEVFGPGGTVATAFGCASPVW